MFRIIRVDHPRHILITMEGRLAGDYVGTAESACGEALSANIPVKILLNNVMEIDARGRDFLRRLLMKRVRLHALGIYSRYIVRTLRKSSDLPS
jgi:hypothetical protein